MDWFEYILILFQICISDGICGTTKLFRNSELNMQTIRKLVPCFSGPFNIYLAHKSVKKKMFTKQCWLLFDGFFSASITVFCVMLTKKTLVWLLVFVIWWTKINMLQQSKKQIKITTNVTKYGKTCFCMHDIITNFIGFK